MRSSDNVIAGFKACGIVPLDAKRVLDKIPNYEAVMPSPQKCCSTLIDHLSRTRASETRPPKPRGKKIDVAPGKGVVVRDMVESEDEDQMVSDGALPSRPESDTSDHESVDDDVEEDLQRTDSSPQQSTPEPRMTFHENDFVITEFKTGQAVMNGDANSIKPYNDVHGHINKGEEEEMEIVGFKESVPLKALTWIGHVLTFGLLRLVFHWWPQFGLYCTHTRCPLEKATKILVIDVYEKRFKSLFVKDIKKISLMENQGYSSQNGKHVGLENRNERTMKVHLADGTIRDMREVRLIQVKKLTYVWVQENHEFVRLMGLDNGRSKEDLCELPGCSREEQKIRQRIYGRNYIEAPIQSILTLVVLEVLNPFYVFQVFSLAIWFSDKYYYYGVAIIIMSVFGISSSVIQTHKNQKNLHDTINQVDLVTVRRKEGIYDEVETTELVPGDIIVVSQSSIACCDALLLNGSCVVNESMLT
ncbi:hypothetical protein GE061_017166, partial [Apolygus lucorum]